MKRRKKFPSSKTDTEQIIELMPEQTSATDAESAPEEKIEPIPEPGIEPNPVDETEPAIAESPSQTIAEVVTPQMSGPTDPVGDRTLTIKAVLNPFLWKGDKIETPGQLASMTDAEIRLNRKNLDFE